MLITPIKEALESIRKTIKDLYRTDEESQLTNRIIYDVEPILETTKKVIDIIERNGVPKFEVETIVGTDGATSTFINDMTSQLYESLRVANIILDEIGDNTNVVLQRFSDQLNQIEPIIQDLTLRIDDIEAQTLEKVTNRSIFDHEVKNVDFARNVQENTCSFEFNTLMLPVVSFVQLLPNSHAININGSQEAKRRLDGQIIADNNKSDPDIIQGTYFGNLVEKLDGNGAFQSQDEYDINELHRTSFNSPLLANYYTTISNDKLDITVRNIFRGAVNFNFMAVKSNVSPIVSIDADGVSTRLHLKNSIWNTLMSTDDISVRLEQSKPQRLEYQGVDIIQDDTIVKRFNYFTSLNYRDPELLKSLNSKVEPDEIVVSPTNQVVDSDRSGFFKYGIELDQIDIRRNTYGSAGLWKSALISTESPIESVEIEVDRYLPDDQGEYISYMISFDNIEWYPLIPRSEGITPFNSDKKRRIVLSNDNDNDDFLFIGPQSQDRGVYLQINMTGSETTSSPAIYNLRLRIKVKENEELQ